MAKKVLVIEDDKFLANAYRVKLEKEGFEVRIAVDGEEGVNTVSEFSPDVVLLDLVMPKKDGFTVLEEIKSDKKWAKLPIIVASNLGQKGDIDKAMKIGAVDYVVKSDEPLSEIIEKLKKYIGTDDSKNAPEGQVVRAKQDDPGEVSGKPEAENKIKVVTESLE